MSPQSCFSLQRRVFVAANTNTTNIEMNDFHQWRCKYKTRERKAVDLVSTGMIGGFFSVSDGHRGQPGGQNDAADWGLRARGLIPHHTAAARGKNDAKRSVFYKYHLHSLLSADSKKEKTQGNMRIFIKALSFTHAHCFYGFLIVSTPQQQLGKQIYK